MPKNDNGFVLSHIISFSIMFQPIFTALRLTFISALLGSLAMASSAWAYQVEKICEDIHNTIVKKQMDMDYLNSTPEVQISEEEEEETVEEETTEEKILNVVDNFNISVYDMQSVVNETNIFEFPSRNFYIYHGGLKMSDKFKVESELLKIENVNYVFFDEEYIKVNHK